MTATVRGVSVDGRGGAINKEGKVEYSATYLVYTSDKRDGPIKAGSAAGIPSLGDLFSVGNDTDVRAVVVNKTVEQAGSPFEWEVKVTWSSDTEKEPKQDINPLDEPAEISYGFQTRRILVPGRFNNPDAPPSGHDFDRGIFTPAGELFDPQPEIDIAEPVLTIVKNQLTINAQAFMALANCVNSDFYQNAEPRQLKMNAPQAVRKWDKTIGFYWTVTYGMAFRWETWDIQILNQGYYYWTSGAPASGIWSSTTSKKVKTDELGTPILVNLTTGGAINTSNTPTYTRLRVFREINFGALGIL